MGGKTSRTADRHTVSATPSTFNKGTFWPLEDLRQACQTTVNDVTNGKHYIHTILPTGDFNRHNKITLAPYTDPARAALNETDTRVAFHNRKCRRRMQEDEDKRVPVSAQYIETNATVSRLCLSLISSVNWLSLIYCVVRQWVAWNSLLKTTKL